MTRESVERTYNKWWAGKYLADGRRIARVEFHAPPSGFYGFAEFVLEDGSRNTTKEKNTMTTPYAERYRSTATLMSAISRKGHYPLYTFDKTEVVLKAFEDRDLSKEVAMFKVEEGSWKLQRKTTQ